MRLWIFASIDTAELHFYRQIKNCLPSSFYASMKFLFPYGFAIYRYRIYRNIFKALIWTHMASTPHMICQNDPCAKPSVKMTFPDPYHEQHWHECPKHLHSPHLDPHSLHQTSHMICQNDPCAKPTVKMFS